MLKKKGEVFFILITGILLKCEAVQYDIRDAMTRGGNLFIKAGRPPKYLLIPASNINDWERHSWLEHDKTKPANVEIFPLSDEIKKQIVDEVNIRRAKTLLGAYFDPERPTEFGIIPPAAHMSMVKYNEDIAQIEERYLQHFIYDHYRFTRIYPYVPMGEILSIENYTVNANKQTTADHTERKQFKTKKLVQRSFEAFFEQELKYYRHFEPYSKNVLQALLDVQFRDPIRNNNTLKEEEKQSAMAWIKYGHFTAILARNIHSVGCALSRQTEQLKHGTNVFTPGKFEFSYILGCNLGGGATTSGLPLYDMDEGFFQMHDIPKSLYNSH